MLEVVPITLKEANAFVEQNHRHHGPTVGHKFSIGLSDGEKIVGVAIVGRPVARHLDDGWTLEVNRLCTDGTRNAFGWTSVAYRVRAYDSAGAESANTTSPTRTVVNNTPPTISGSDSDLGAKTGAFSQAYTVTDVDSGQTITVVEKIDGVQKRSYTATSGQEYTFNVTADEWVKLSNGSHTLTITATDNYGGAATRTYTFSKNETEIEITLATPLPADAMITKAIMSVTRQIPAGAEFAVEVCNNGNDDSPTWEDVTQAVNSGSKFFLSNEEKTAENP